ncbi:MAG: DUF924 family protein [Hyphomicrobiaceae bacterium]
MTVARSEESWVQAVLTFWFAEMSPADWFTKSQAIDNLISARFREIFEQVKARTIEELASSPERALAAVIVLDQFPRNMFRDTPAAFATDARALALSAAAIERGHDANLDQAGRKFLYMPYQHSEDRGEQARSIELFARLGEPETLDFAIRHKDIVDRFGRFPHRNAILGRISTAEELAFLEEPGSSF